MNTSTINGAEYNTEDNTASYYVDGYLVATLDFDTDVFEEFEDMSEKDGEFYYGEMTSSKNDYKYNKSMVLVESDYR